MTPREALFKLCSYAMKPSSECGLAPIPMSEDELKEYKEALLPLIDKNEPKELINYQCQCCGYVPQHFFEFCPICGQRYKW